MAAEMNLTPPGSDPVRLAVLRVSGEFLPMLGIEPIAGRMFRPSDDVVGGPDVALISKRTLDLGRQLAGLDVQVHIYERGRPSFPFCTDVGFADVVEEVWRPTRVTVTVQLVPGVFPVRASHLARATIRIFNAQFVSPAGFALTRRSRSR
jgi:hypothetical protein